MRNFQLVGVILVIIGSFSPLVHIPIIGNWNYFDIDKFLAVFCWIFSLLAIIGIVKEKSGLIKTSSILLMILFVFTIIAVKFKSLNYFSFLPFDSWTESAAGIVKLKWGWFLEFAGAAIVLLSKNNVKNSEI